MYIDGANIPSVFVAQPENKYNIEAKKPGWIEVLVDCPRVAGLFTYGLPPQLQVKPGDVVSVPFGTQVMGGIAIRLLHELPTEISPEKVRNVEDVVSSGFVAL